DSAAWVDGLARAAITSRSGDAAKSPTCPTRVADRPTRLAGIINLVFGDTLGLRRLHGPAVAGILSRAMIRFVLDEPSVHQADLDRLVLLAHDVDVMELQRPRGMEHLDAVVRFLDRVLT